MSAMFDRLVPFTTHLDSTAGDRVGHFVSGENVVVR